MLGIYENFPENIHLLENFASTLPSQKLQRKLIQTLHGVNKGSFRLEEVSQPSLHDCTVIFEVGIADTKNFSYIDDDEAKTLMDLLRKKTFQIMDFFVAVRYYTGTAETKKSLRFDYYMLRFVFDPNRSVELRVFHERGPRHLSPEDLVIFLLKRVNEGSSRAVLKRIAPSHDDAN